jgi:hypothetical protein
MRRTTVVGPRARFLGASAIALLAFALLSGPASAAGGSGIVAVTGQVGKLQIDKSDRAAVLAFAGTPDQEIKQRVLGFPSYDALGYDCSDTESADNFPIGNSGPYCVTIFFVDIATHSLEDFVSSSASYHERNGVRIGTSVSDAQRLLKRQVSRSCGVVLKVDGAKAALRINFAHGKADTFVLHSLKRTAGLFNCTR